MQELRAQFLLQLRDLRAERGLRDVQAVGRAGEIQLFGKDRKIA
jgi:hypothetical protein